MIRPFATLWSAAVHNLFVPVARYSGEGDLREAVVATPQVHRHGAEHSKWNFGKFPLLRAALDLRPSQGASEQCTPNRSKRCPVHIFVPSCRARQVH